MGNVTFSDVNDKFTATAAQWACIRLEGLIEDFKNKLKPNEDYSCRVSSGCFVLEVDDVGFWNPDFVIFRGHTVDGARTQLSQHISQINLLLSAVPRFGNAPRKQIGFAHHDQAQAESTPSLHLTKTTI